ncbi:MAG TPA: DUF6282 family protein [Trebonia sp.]
MPGSRRWPTSIIDTHVHASPDVVPRRGRDRELVAEAAGAGYRALVLKNHHTPTMGRAQLLQELGDGMQVLGGLVLNTHSTGGINPDAVESALLLGCRVVWMPTFTAANHVRAARRDERTRGIPYFGQARGDGVHALDADGSLLPETAEVLDLLARHDATLATGHLGPAEIMAVVPEARRRGVRRVIVTHPEMPFVELSLDDQVQLAALDGVWFERVAYVVSTGQLSMRELAATIRAVGPSTTILASDLGQPDNPPPVEGLTRYVRSFLEAGFSADQVEEMCSVAPARALGLT